MDVPLNSFDVPWLILLFAQMKKEMSIPEEGLSVTGVRTLKLLESLIYLYFYSRKCSLPTAKSSINISRSVIFVVDQCPDGVGIAQTT
jgi:hypothetical protein